jgi:DNA-directed RNA polymerase subunit RPC12/RpoP
MIINASPAKPPAPLEPVLPVTAALQGHVQAECPECGHKFLHKLGHVLKEAAVETVEAAGNIVAQAGNLGGDS